jgi:hypothetical protein
LNTHDASAKIIPYGKIIPMFHENYINNLPNMSLMQQEDADSGTTNSSYCTFLVHCVIIMNSYFKSSMFWNVTPCSPVEVQVASLPLLPTYFTYSSALKTEAICSIKMLTNTSTGLNSITSQNTILLIVTAVRTSNSTSFYLSEVP